MALWAPGFIRGFGGEELMRLPALLALLALVGFVILELVLRPV